MPIDLESPLAGHMHLQRIHLCALGLKKAAAMLENDFIADAKAKRYAGWNGELGEKILNGAFSLESLAGLTTA